MSDTTRDQILIQARARFGIPYGLPPGPGETDCSLYVRDVYEAAGLPFSAGVRIAEQERQDTVPIAFHDVLPGDLLFFEGTYDAGPPSADGHIASHIGISLGAGTLRMYDANDGRGTSGETNIGTPYWQGHMLEARRHPALIGTTDAVPRLAQPRGVDVASHQGTIDWQAVARSGISFGFTKATGGAWYTNPTFTANWLNMKAAGIQRGAYHYAFESSGQPFPGPGPEAEADFFLKTMQPLGFGPGDMVALDIEEGNGPLGDWALRWCRRVEAALGWKPLVYTGAWFSVPHGFGSVPQLAGYPLWLAAYQDDMPEPPDPWDDIAIWQHSDEGQVPGINANVDLNLYNGTAAGLAALGKPGGSTEPGPIYAPPGTVGTGILQMMAEDGTQPAMPSTFLPLGASPAMGEQCWGLNGTQYIWHIPTGRHWRYPAA